MPVKPFSTHIFLLIFFSQTALAQYADLKNDDNVPWIAEFSMDHDFSSSSVSDQQNIVKLIKFYNDPTTLYGANTDDWIINWIFANAMDGHYECYKDPELSNQLSQSDLLNLTISIDTVITFYPETFEEVIEIKKVEIHPSNINSLRTKQIIFYNQKSGNFDTKLIAVAPLMAIDSDNNLTPLFWIKMDAEFPNPIDIQAPNISWGVLLDTKGSPFDLKLAKEVKNENNFDFKKRIQKHAFNLERPVENAKGFGCDKFLSKKEVGNLYNSIDTIITFDPQTFQETVEIKQYNFDPNAIANYRLVQEWYYDRETKKMMNRLKAICPLYIVESEDGKIKYAKKGSRRYAKSLYFIRYN